MRKIKEKNDYSIKCAGNWKHFQSFGWQHAYDGELIEPERYVIWNIENRDSNILEQSNSAAIQEIMKWYLVHGFAHIERHYHWACGWTEAIVMPVYTLKGYISQTFWYFIDHVLARLENCPILDENDYSERELQQQYDNAMDAIHWYERDYDKDFSESEKNEIYYVLSEDYFSQHGSDWYPNMQAVIDCVQKVGLE